MILQTVGDILRAAREKQGISIKDVEKATSIRALYIQAIEEGNYSIMPGEVYLKGFIRNYANYLGLDGQEMVNIYRQSVSAETVTVQEAEKPAKRRSSSAGTSSGRKWVLILIVIVVVVAGWLVWSFLSQHPAESQQPASPPQSSQQTPAVPAPALPSPVKAPEQQTQTAPGSRPVTVVAKYSSQCWTLVTADGKEIFEGTPKAGETLTWNAEQNVTVKLGNASAVDVTFNGQPQAKLGGAGEVVVKTFNASPATIKKP